MVSAASAADARKGQLDAVIATMRANAKLDDHPPHPGSSFLAARKVPVPQELAEAPEFIDAQKASRRRSRSSPCIYAEDVMAPRRATSTRATSMRREESSRS
jgi:hypothetical protein